MPWALGEPPGDIFGGGPPTRKQRARKQTKDLPTINERPAHHVRSPLSQRADASFSSTDLRRESLDEVMSVGSGSGREREGEKERGERERGETPRKVQKGQITALAKMLSAFKK